MTAKVVIHENLVRTQELSQMLARANLDSDLLVLAETIYIDLLQRKTANLFGAERWQVRVSTIKGSVTLEVENGSRFEQVAAILDHSDHNCLTGIADLAITVCKQIAEWSA